MNIQEREELDYTPMTSMEMLYAEDMMFAKFERVNRNHVNWLSSLGFYVVIGVFAVYGHETDALIGHSEYIERVTRSTGEVEDVVERLAEYDDAHAIVIYPEPR